MEFTAWFNERFEVKKGKFYRNGKKVSEYDVLSSWDDTDGMNPDYKPMSVKAIKGMLAEDDDEKQKFIFNTEECMNWLNEHSSDWEISLDGKVINRITGGVTRSSDLDSLASEMVVSFADRDIVVGKDCVRNVVSNYLDKREHQGAIELRDSIAYDPSCKVKCDAFLASLYKYLQPNETLEMFLCLMRHWGWCVKRKLNSKPVVNHIWVSLYGGAGIGKTTLVRKLCKPFSCYAVDTTLGKVLDSTKEIKVLTSNYILNLDELAVNREDGNQDDPLTKDQMSVLKSIITGEDITARVYGTQQQARRKVTFCCISTSNEHLYDIIFDDATMRRYFEFTCTRTIRGTKKELDELSSKYWDNAIDFWKGINEDNDFGYWNVETELGKEISKAQELYYPTKRTTMIWVAHVRKTAGETGYTKNATPMELYAHYKVWCNDAGCKSCSLPNFEKFLRRFVPEIVADGYTDEERTLAWCKYIGKEPNDVDELGF